MRRAFRYFFISIISIIITLIVVGVIYIVVDTQSRIEVEDGQIYSSEEVEKLVDEAKEEAKAGKDMDR